jgi:hypothetical protein
MMLVPVADRRNAVRLCIDNQEMRRGAEVIVHGAFDALIRLNRKTDLHNVFLLCAM